MKGVVNSNKLNIISPLATNLPILPKPKSQNNNHNLNKKTKKDPNSKKLQHTHTIITNVSTNT